MIKIELNSDLELVKEIKAKLKESNGYCPCSLVKSQDTKCMCKAFRDQKTEGLCHCGLYYKRIS